MVILIKGLSVSGCHGMLASEKTQPQNFIIDMELTIPSEKAAWSDDLVDTVSYSSVCLLLTEIIENENFNLIERLAGRLTEAVFDTFQEVSEIVVTVKKPKPPMKGDFDYMGVQLKRMRADG
jgi:dihydroneopterin aldolase